jgi:hypothetical protein
LRCAREKPAGVVVHPTVDICRHEQNYTRDWIRTVAGSIEILKYAVDHHGLCHEYMEAVRREIISRSILGIDCSFRDKRFADVTIFAENLGRDDMPLKTAIKIGVSKQPKALALLLSSALTAGASAAGLQRLSRRRRG